MSTQYWPRPIRPPSIDIVYYILRVLGLGYAAWGFGSGHMRVWSLWFGTVRFGNFRVSHFAFRFSVFSFWDSGSWFRVHDETGSGS